MPLGVPGGMALPPGDAQEPACDKDAWHALFPLDTGRVWANGRGALRGTLSGLPHRGNGRPGSVLHPPRDGAHTPLVVICQKSWLLACLDAG